MITETTEIKFGDEKLIDMLKRKKKKDLEKCKITIDLNMLMKVGMEKHMATNLLERLINIKKK